MVKKKGCKSRVWYIYTILSLWIICLLMYVYKVIYVICLMITIRVSEFFCDLKPINVDYKIKLWILRLTTWLWSAVNSCRKKLLLANPAGSGYFGRIRIRISKKVESSLHPDPKYPQNRTFYLIFNDPSYTEVILYWSFLQNLKRNL